MEKIVKFPSTSNIITSSDISSLRETAKSLDTPSPIHTGSTMNTGSALDPLDTTSLLDNTSVLDTELPMDIPSALDNWQKVFTKQNKKKSKAEKYRETKPDLKLDNRFLIFEEELVEDNIKYSEDGEDGKDETLENTQQVPRKRKSFPKKKITTSNKQEIKLSDTPSYPVNFTPHKKRTELRGNRCFKCFIAHFPYAKFCRWAQSSRK